MRWARDDGTRAPRRRRGGARVSAALLAAGLAAGGAGAAGAAEPEADAAQVEYAYELAEDLMSPFCPGRSLSECPSPQAADLRQWIVERDRAGVPRSEVEAILFERWGDELRQAPRPEGVGLAAYLIPAAAFVAGGGVLALFWRRQRRRAAAEGASAPAPLAAVDPELERTLEEEMRRDEAAGGSAR